jgi:hypothetical protein
MKTFLYTSAFAFCLLSTSLGFAQSAGGVESGTPHVGIAVTPVQNQNQSTQPDKQRQGQAIKPAPANKSDGQKNPGHVGKPVKHEEAATPTTVPASTDPKKQTN